MYILNGMIGIIHLVPVRKLFCRFLSLSNSLPMFGDEAQCLCAPFSPMPHPFSRPSKFSRNYNSN